VRSKVGTEIGLFINYTLLLIGVILFDWESFNLLLAFILEYISLLIVYLFVSVVARKKQSLIFFTTLSHLINGLGLGVFQAAFILLLAFFIDGQLAFSDNVAKLPWLIPSILLYLLILNFLALHSKKIDSHLEDEKMSELATLAVSFPIYHFSRSLDL
jgi:hypothetical protein